MWPTVELEFETRSLSLQSLGSQFPWRFPRYLISTNHWPFVCFTTFTKKFSEDCQWSCHSQNLLYPLLGGVTTESHQAHPNLWPHWPASWTTAASLFCLTPSQPFPELLGDGRQVPGSGQMQVQIVSWKAPRKAFTTIFIFLQRLLSVNHDFSTNWKLSLNF